MIWYAAAPSFVPEFVWVSSINCVYYQVGPVWIDMFFLFKIFRCYWLRKLMMMIHDHESWIMNHESWIMIVQSTKHEGQPELWSWVTKQWYFASASTSPERCLKRKLDASNSKSTDAMLGFTLDMKRRSS